MPDIYISDDGDATVDLQKYTETYEQRIKNIESERDTLRELIEAHNNACHAACVWRERNRGCSDYTSRGKTCSECPMDYIIDYQMQENPNA